MDVNDWRIAVTVISLVLFVAIVVHTWSRRRRAEHEQAARLPFLDSETGGGAPTPGDRQ